MPSDDKKTTLNLPAIPKKGWLSNPLSKQPIRSFDIKKRAEMSRIVKEGKGAGASLQAEIARQEQGLDLVLVGDLTGSMEQYHTLLKNQFSSLSKNLFQMIRNLRIGIVFYLDHGSGDPYVSHVNPLGRDIESMQNFIASTQTGCGGDEDEAVEDALNDIVNMQWREIGSRSVVLFGDARAHEANDCPNGYDYFNLIKQIYDKDIVVNCVFCGDFKGSSDDLQKLENVDVGDFSKRVSNLDHPNFFSWIANVTGGMIIGVDKIDELLDIIKAAAAKDSGKLDEYEKYITDRNPNKLNLIKIAKKAENRRRLAHKSNPRLPHNG